MRNDCEISSVRKYAAEECYALRSTEIINFVRMEEWYFFFSGARLSECVVSWEWKAKAGRRCMWFQVSERRNCPRVKNNCRFIILCLVTAGAWPGPSHRLLMIAVFLCFLFCIIKCIFIISLNVLIYMYGMLRIYITFICCRSTWVFAIHQKNNVLAYLETHLSSLSTDTYTTLDTQPWWLLIVCVCDVRLCDAWRCVHCRSVKTEVPTQINCRANEWKMIHAFSTDEKLGFVRSSRRIVCFVFMCTVCDEICCFGMMAFSGVW